MVVLLYTYILLLLLFIFVISCHRNLNLMFLVILVLGLGFSSGFEYWRKHDTDICFKIDTCQSFVSSCISYIQEEALPLVLIMDSPYALFLQSVVRENLQEFG